VWVHYFVHEVIGVAFETFQENIHVCFHQSLFFAKMNPCLHLVCNKRYKTITDILLTCDGYITNE
jgi:hypothetical protein